MEKSVTYMYIMNHTNEINTHESTSPACYLFAFSWFKSLALPSKVAAIGGFGVY